MIFINKHIQPGLKCMFLMALLCGAAMLVYSQHLPEKDSLPGDTVHHQEELEAQQALLQETDSLIRLRLRQQLKQAGGDKEKMQELEGQLKTINIADSLKHEQQIQFIQKLRKHTRGYPVTLFNDTLFYIYVTLGAQKPADRAAAITQKIRTLYDNDFLKLDSVTTASSNYNTVNVVYNDLIILSISDLDALWEQKSKQSLATQYAGIIRQSIASERQENRLVSILKRIGLVLLILIVLVVLIWMVGKLIRRIEKACRAKKDKLFHSIRIKNYTLITIEQELAWILSGLKVLKWLLILLILFLGLPLIFSVFPFTKDWAEGIFTLVWYPFKRILIAVWHYLPNLITILVIYFVMRYFIKGVRYLFSEIASEKLYIRGFHSDWALPTFSIVRILLYAFMIVLIFPYLPGSNSAIFKGVTIFIGILFSLGSSSAIANLVAGLVITYMGAFTVGDWIKIGDVSGEVIEKNMLLTRLRTYQNEVITIPNSAILSGNTINYSGLAKSKGIMLHATVTIGYNVPWKKMHDALLEAAARVSYILKDPPPFVLQTALNDFYVAYKVNAFTKEVRNRPLVLSLLHQNIQDVCNERGIEICSPHYNAHRDGNASTIPSDYLPDDYQPEAFHLHINPNKDKQEEKK